jgi:hypothetical protein
MLIINSQKKPMALKLKGLFKKLPPQKKKLPVVLLY